MPSLVYGNPIQLPNTSKMKYSYSAFAILALSGMAQAVIPTCAQPCIAASVAKVTTCGADDLACQCTATNEAAIQSDATTCVLSDCGATEALGMCSFPRVYRV